MGYSLTENGAPKGRRSRKRLEFSKVSQCEIAYALFYITIAVSLAFKDFCAWSLVYAHIVARLVETTCLLRISDWQPRLVFDRTIAVLILRSGIYFWGFAVMSTVGSLHDRAFTARLLGSTSMGIYRISYSLCTLPASQIALLVNQISFPAMAKMQDDLARLQNSFLKALSHVCLLAIPIATGLYLVAGDLIPSLYGSKWDAAIPVVRILAFYGMVVAIASVTNPVLMAMGKEKQLLYTSIFHHSLLFTNLWFVADLGLQKGALAVLLTLIISTLVAFFLVMHHVKIGALSILEPICRTGIAAIFMALIVTMTQDALRDSISQLQMLLITIPIGAVAFILANVVVNRTISLDVMRTMSSVMSKRTL